MDPFVLVVEEPEAIEPNLLERVASEGRKFGVSMCLLSQHPTEIWGRVLSQVGCHLMGRMTDARDLEWVGSLAGDKAVLLPKLRMVEWVINGINLGRPVKVLARERYSLSI